MVNSQVESFQPIATITIRGHIGLYATGRIGLAVPFIGIAGTDRFQIDGVAIMDCQIKHEGTVAPTWRSGNGHRIQNALVIGDVFPWPIILVALRSGVDMMEFVTDGQFKLFQTTASKAIGGRMIIGTRLRIGRAIPSIALTSRNRDG